MITMPYDVSRISTGPLCPRLEDASSDLQVPQLMGPNSRVPDEAVRERMEQLFSTRLAFDRGFVQKQAHVIELAISRLRWKTEDMLLKKRPDADMASLIVSSRVSSVFLVLSRRTKGFLVGEGGSKRVIVALRIPFDATQAPEVLVKRVSRVIWKGPTLDLERTEWTADYFLRELSLVGQVPGIDRPIIAYESRRMRVVQGAPVVVRKITAIEKCYQTVSWLAGDTGRLFESVHVASCLANQLAWCHENGLTHGDIKQDNGLWLSDGHHIEAKWTDWAFAKKLVDWRLSTKEFYGSIVYTPPEMFGLREPFQGDPCKVECWAFGMFLYELFFNMRLPWCDWVYTFFARGVMTYERDKVEFERRVRSFWEQGAPTPEPDSVQADVLRLVGALLNLSPASRPSMREVYMSFDHS